MTTTINITIDGALLNEIQTLAKQERRTARGEVAYLLDLGAKQYGINREAIRKMDRAAVDDTTTREQGDNVLQFPCIAKGDN